MIYVTQEPVNRCVKCLSTRGECLIAEEVIVTTSNVYLQVTFINTTYN